MIPTELLAPIISGIVAVIITTLGAIMARRGAKIGSKENRAPDVQEMWAQQETDRRIRQLVEDMWWNIRRAFQTYYRRVQLVAAEKGIDDPRLELTAKEQKIIDTPPPADE